MDEAEARDIVAKSTADKAKSVEEAYSKMGKPTPTQEENDLAALGVPVDPKEDDGSGPDPNSPEGQAASAKAAGERAERAKSQRRQSEPNRPAGGGYQTRTAAPAPAREPAKPQS